MGRRPTGTVEARTSSIRLKFNWQGQRCSETLELPPTAANMRAAARTLEEIQRRIASGAFDYAEFFPDSARAGASGNTFRDVAKTWLATRTDAKSTVASYATAVNFWNRHVGDKQVRDILQSDLKRAVADQAKECSGKTINNYLVAVRGVFELSVGDRLIPADKNPAAGLKNMAFQTPEPDPLDFEEMELVLGDMAARYDEQVWNYFEVAFTCGMRPSEQIALSWDDIDWRKKKAAVHTAIVLGEEKGTKTNSVRHIDLTDRAVAALKRQRVHTAMKPSGLVFNNPKTGEPWSGSQVQRRLYWNPTLRRLGLRQRDFYQTRHTYATLNLMAGVNLAYLAKQMGHANLGMLLKHYGRWIEDGDGGRESSKVNDVFSPKRPNNVPGKTGTVDL